jgi:hypothetical protein
VKARLLFIALWVNSDDYGVVKGSPLWLKSQAYPYDDFTIENVKEWLAQLEKIKCIVPFGNNGEGYYYIRNWNKYQKINRPSKFCRNPLPPHGILSECSMSCNEALIDETETETETETQYSEKKMKTKFPDDFVITDKMREWFESKQFRNIDIENATEAWVDHWRSCGKKMADWVATWRNGMRLAEKWASNGQQPEERKYV